MVKHSACDHAVNPSIAAPNRQPPNMHSMLPVPPNKPSVQACCADTQALWRLCPTPTLGRHPHSVQSMRARVPPTTSWSSASPAYPCPASGRYVLPCMQAWPATEHRKASASWQLHSQAMLVSEDAGAQRSCCILVCMHSGCSLTGVRPSECSDMMSHSLGCPLQGVQHAVWHAQSSMQLQQPRARV